jgi:two-component system response regulator HydG
MPAETILVLDDDPGFRGLLTAILRGEGYEVNEAGKLAAAKRLGAERQYHLLLTDLRLPDGDGLEALRHFRETSPETPVIVITAFASVETAVEAMKLGAADYLGKPLSSPDELRLLVRRTLDARRAAHESAALREEIETRFACNHFLTRDPRMQEVMQMARKVAETDATVLLLGESGTGKEVLARCLHLNSKRAARAFVPVNCAALSPTLIESELFGHEKGSFTGATGQHVGRFERAHGGTIFLDEIGELDGHLQAKLLRVLQEKTFERVGGTRLISADVRILAATNRDLAVRVAAREFREDLYYRLSAFPLQLPPLRERPADIPLLAEHFLHRAAAALGRPVPKISPAALTALKGYTWPGNARELENVMERAVILAADTITPADLPFTETSPRRPLTLDEIERQAILAALRENQNNRTRAAQQLGISLRTLQYRLKEYGFSEA